MMIENIIGVILVPSRHLKMELKVLILIYLTKRLEIKTKNETLYNNLLIYITKLILQVSRKYTSLVTPTHSNQDR